MNYAQLAKHLSLALLGWLIVQSIHAAQVADSAGSLQRLEQSLRRVPSAYSDSTLVVAWNRKAYQLAFAEDQFLTFKGHRALAMMHLAMHDALNAVIPVYRQYLPTRSHGKLHPLVAAAQAAHDVLASQYPKEQTGLAAELERWLAPVPPGRPKWRAVALGRRIAGAMLARAASNGWDFPGAYAFDPEAGKYRTTPPWNGFVAQPGFRFARPFGLNSADQFRPAPPPALRSAEYARDYQEAKDYGAANSALRTAEQNAYALWWMEFAEGAVNRLASELAASERLHLWRAARMFALMNMSLYDGYIATWDAKYEYNTWRPYSAIREAEADGNPATLSDDAWEPLRPTPPFPEYVSAHAAGCNAAFAILQDTFGDNIAFTMTTTTAPPHMPTRSFASFELAAKECADSRVRNGFHFRYATETGSVLGREVAGHMVRQYFRPISIGYRDRDTRRSAPFRSGNFSQHSAPTPGYIASVGKAGCNVYLTPASRAARRARSAEKLPTPLPWQG